MRLSRASSLSLLPSPHASLSLSSVINDGSGWNLSSALSLNSLSQCIRYALAVSLFETGVHRELCDKNGRARIRGIRERCTRRHLLVVIARRPRRRRYFSFRHRRSKVRPFSSGGARPFRLDPPLNIFLVLILPTMATRPFHSTG